MEICSKDFSEKTHKTLNSIIDNKLWSYEYRQKLARDVMSIVIKRVNGHPDYFSNKIDNLLKQYKFCEDISNYIEKEKFKIISLYKNSSKQISYINQCGIIPPCNIDNTYLTNILLNNYPMYPINI